MSKLAEIKTKYGNRIKIFEKSPRRVYLDVKKEEAAEILDYLFNELEARLSTATALDVREGVEILYHMALDEEGVMLSIRVIVPKPDLKMDSITPRIPSADWIEREIHEMLGVDFIGHPELKRLLLPDDWPSDVYPLRKSFSLKDLEGKNG
jgi:Ni,Fe-hydrogenase III component G